MSNENKTALTAEDNIIWWFMQFCEAKGDYYIITDKNLLLFSSKLSEDTSRQTQEKDKEIAELKSSLACSERFRIEDAASHNYEKIQDWERIKKLQSTIESQQKEIEELKRAIEDEKKVCLRVMDYNSELESQLSEVTKERDELRVWNKAIVSLMNEHYNGLTIDEVLKLTPTKE